METRDTAEWREYTATLSFNLSEMGQATEAQRVAYNAARNRESESTIRNNLNSLALTASVLSAIFGQLAVAGIASTAYSVLIVIGASGSLEAPLQVGLDRMTKNLTWFATNNQRYKRIEFEVAFIEYTVTTSSGRQNIRFIQQTSDVKRAQLTDGTWISQIINMVWLP